MCDRWRGRTMGLWSRLLFQTVLAVHIAAGSGFTLGLLRPAGHGEGQPNAATARRMGLCRRRGVRCGDWILVVHPARDRQQPLRWRAGVFLAYVSLLAGASTQFGVRARTKGRSRAS